MKLFTGGKGIPGQKSLFVLSGWALRVADKWAIPPYDSSTRMEPIPNGNVRIGELGTLGADGYLYVSLPDRATKDVTPTVPGEQFYTFDVGGSRHRPFVTANGILLDPRSVVGGAEFCVGQKITFALGFTPSLAFSDHVSHWKLPEKYVNEEYEPIMISSPPPTLYRINDDLLTELTTPCWFVNGSGGTASIGTSLGFSNGQTASIAAMGRFSIHRPSFSGFQCVANEFFWNPPTLMARMRWMVQVDSQFDGELGITQLIKGQGVYDTSGFWWLDGDSVTYDPPQQYTVAQPWTHSIDLEDTPHMFAAPCITMSANFKDYLRFRPVGSGSIGVTLGANGWSMHGEACLGFGAGPTNVTPASALIDTDEFPDWDGVRHE